MLAMMADNIEHVITYWVLWQTFHSNALAGFQVISHWVPFLVLSVPFGALADRYDCRRVVQTAQLLFMSVSAAWGVLFLTGGLTIWLACILLVVHGVAGALWGPGEQLLLQDFVGPDDLPSAVRMNATGRSVGILFGPVIGTLLLVALGPTAGIFVNIAIYLPLTLFLLRTRFTGHLRSGGREQSRLTPADAVRVLRNVRADRPIVGMIMLSGLSSFFVAAAMQAVMPIFADDMHGFTDQTAYSALLIAYGLGGVLGGLLLELASRVPSNVATAACATGAFALCTLTFALTDNLVLACALLLVGGIGNVAATAIGQTVVQLRAAPADRGKVIGVYSMSSMGLRAGSGFTVGLLGQVIGVHWSLGLSSAVLAIGVVGTAWYALERTSDNRIRT